jgi:lipopolysaccharide assembly outer membrane protein LptD (OstA)
MGRNFAKVLIIITAVFLIYGCSRKEEDSVSVDKSGEKITGFSIKQFSGDKTSFFLKGETAEVFAENVTSIATPELSLNTATESIEIKTGREGKGEIKIVPDEKKIQTVIITGDVRIIYKDIKTGSVTMEGKCSKLTYDDKRKILIMEGSPVVMKDKSYFKSDVIHYKLDTNTLELKGNVNATLYTEEEPSD